MTLRQLLHKRWHRRLLAGVEMIKLALMDRLTKQYQPVYGKESADLLAAAVVNRIFHHQPTDHLFLEFKALNQKTIKREMNHLLQDKDLNHVICQALRVQAQLIQEQMSHPKEPRFELVNVETKFDQLAIRKEMLTSHDFVEMAKKFQHDYSMVNR